MNSYEQVFRNSYSRALGNNSYNADFIDNFYKIFFSKSDLVAKLFAHTNMSGQKTMLHDSLDTLVEFYTHKKLTQQLKHLAKIHGKGGHSIPLELFDVWMESLIEAVGQADPEFNDEVELAWRLVLIPGITYIRFMANR